MATVEPHETIISLIKICRKLEACNSLQLTKCMNQYLHIFDKHDASKLFINIFVKGLSHYHSSISSQLFNDLLIVLPSEKKLKINDSITKSDIKLKKKKQQQQEEKEKEKEKLTFLKIPKELKIHAFNYLTENELFQTQKVCRCLNLAARDPNSLYHLTASNHDKKVKYSHPWYSRIKSLALWCKASNSKWCQSVTCLASTVYIVNGNFTNLEKALLGPEPLQMLINNKIDFVTLRELNISCRTLNGQILSAIMKCINLEKLDLSICASSTFEPQTERVIDTESIMNDENIKLFQNIKQNPFRKLRVIALSGIILEELQIFVYWMIASHCKKHLKLKSDYFQRRYLDTSQLFKADDQFGIHALMNIEHLSILDVRYTSILMNMCKSFEMINKSKFDNNFKPLNCTDLFLRYDDYAIINNELFNALNSIASNSDSSKLTLYIEHENRDITEPAVAFGKWMSNIFNSNSKSFDRMRIMVEDCSIHNIDYREDMEDINYMLAQNTANENKLCKEGKEIGEIMLQEFNEWLKPLSMINKQKMQNIGMKCIDIKYISYYADIEYILDSESSILQREHCFVNGVFCEEVREAAAQNLWNNAKMALTNGFAESIKKSIEQNIGNRCKVKIKDNNQGIEIVFKMKM